MNGPAAARLRAFALLFLLVLASRLPVMSRSVLDWDESLYILMAQAWLAGHLPYTTIWDNKPIGIYAIFALSDVLARQPILAIRLASIFAITATAYGIWRLTPLVLARRPGGFADGLAWLASLAFVAGSLTNDGQAANTEIFMECFSTFAVLAAIDPASAPAPAPAWRRGFIVGLLFGLACMTKYVAIFEAPAIAWALILHRPAARREMVFAGFGAMAGAALPPGLTVLAYGIAGQFSLWWACAIAANVRRVAVAVPAGALHRAFFSFLPHWLPMDAAALALLAAVPFTLAGLRRRRRLSAAARTHALLLLWLVGGGVGVASSKSYFDHYFLQILPVLCLSLAWALQAAAPLFQGKWRALAPVLFAILLAQPLADGLAALAVWRQTPDTAAAMAADLRPAIAAGASLYVFDSQPILYALTKAAPPTRYVFPSVLSRCALARVAGVAAGREVARLLALNPTFIVISRDPPSAPGVANPAVYGEVGRDLRARYAPWRRYPDAAIFRLLADPPPLPAFRPLAGDCSVTAPDAG